VENVRLSPLMTEKELRSRPGNCSSYVRLAESFSFSIWSARRDDAQL